MEQEYTAELTISDHAPAIALAAVPVTSDDLVFDDNGVLISAPLPIEAPTASAEPPRQVMAQTASLATIIWTLHDLVSQLSESVELHGLVVVDEDRRPILRVFDVAAFVNALVDGQSGDINRLGFQAQQLAQDNAALVSDRDGLVDERGKLQKQLHESEAHAQSILQDANWEKADLQARLDAAETNYAALLKDYQAALGQSDDSAESSDQDTSKPDGSDEGLIASEFLNEQDVPPAEEVPAVAKTKGKPAR